ncbi:MULTISPECIES: hypothetical protein [unclassified Kitasatospora]|uniref:hypothetical protein n=1 Tax=unclassified Kitasatospora TaxID=2633591 RepID=UPI000708DA9C|nr:MULTISPECIES: hypothetical protein [unclassified Kitasatospora]KQV20820.1 hypothetical protein ASC99_20130 [Kitasatospora sp. Root107]KRB60524.1 hypothetical protein ASE03_13050 [Kitasatospora sp. Root187]
MPPTPAETAWALYCALHDLAAGHVVGQITDSVDQTEDIGEHFDALDLHHLALSGQIRSLIADWPRNPSGCLPGLLDRLDDLSALTGGHLPLPVPPLLET